MSDTTPKLQLPLILPAQAQKHVTHNEALMRLDTLTQASSLSRSVATPPPAPAEGDSYLVASGATGDWAGQDGSIAEFRDGAWQFVPPAEGWLSWVADETTHVHFDGVAWTALPAPQEFSLVGVGTVADAQNPLSVSGSGALFTHSGSDHRLTINKSTVSDTASVVFQTNFSGRAEIGLTGSDDMEIKVSADGSAFSQAVSIDGASGRVTFPNGGGAPNIVQVRNSDTTTDLNSSVFTAAPITGITDHLDSGWFAISGNGVECLRAGRVRASASLHITSTNQRPNLNVRLAVNGVGLPGFGASGYIRSQSDHDHSSVSITRYVDVAAGDVITVETEQEAWTGGVTMTAGNSLLILEQW